MDIGYCKWVVTTMSSKCIALPSVSDNNVGIGSNANSFDRLADEQVIAILLLDGCSTLANPLS